MEGKIKREKRTIEAMIRFYCRKKHGGNDLCEECVKMLKYAIRRVDRCIFHAEKPACKDCPVHCYAPLMKEQVKEVMRFSGPRMILKHPVLAFMHLIM
jgi:hypothetical protein